MANDVSVTPISGTYTAKWDDKDLGNTEDGFVLRQIGSWEDVLSDAGGDTVLTQIWRGSNVFVEFNGLELEKLLTAGIMYPVNTLINGYPGNTTDEVGTNIFSSAKPLVITPVAGLGNRTDIFTFPKTILVGDVTTTLSSSFTRVPVTFRAFPDVDTNDNHYTVTT